jgi:two-component system sensor histidine kinase RpfC
MEARSAKRTPSIVLSADATMEASEAANEVGAKAFLTKPIVVARLLEAIADVVDNQKLPAVRAISDIVRPVADPAVLEELAAMRLGGQFLQDFVEQCLQDATRCMQGLAREGAAANWTEFREVAHALKGIAGNIGAASVAERCSQIMKANDDTLARQQGKLVAELQAQLTAVAELTRQEVSRLIRGSGQNMDAPDIS